MMRLLSNFKYIFLFGFMIFITMVTVLVPPFQAPDEFKHFERAYTISKGEFLLHENGNGLVDKHLIEFEKVYEVLPFKHDNRVSAEMSSIAKSYKWSKEYITVPLSNTAVYFPLPYIPLSLGIFLGEKLELSIYQTYKFAKYTTIFFCLLLIFLANKIYPITYLGYFLLALPMTTFQIASANPDGILFSLSIVLGAIILKGYKSNDLSFGYFVLGCGIVFIISTMKMNVLPIILLLIPIAYFNKISYGYRTIFLTIFLILLWIAFAYSYTLSGEHFSQSGMNASSKLNYYLSHKIEFINMFINTFIVKEPNLLSMYYQQFIGVLGWIDVHFSQFTYKIILSFLIVFLLFGVDFRRLFSTLSLFKLIILISSIFLTFFLLLITWTPIEEKFIHGVQGRYFIPLALIYSFFYIKNSKFEFLYQIVVLGMLTFSNFITLNALIERYYLR